MRETNHDSLKYQGEAGEEVIVTVTASTTIHMVEFVIDGQLPARVLPAGTPIRFRLKNGSGAQTSLQINLQFQPNGRYDVHVGSVTGCPFDDGTGVCRTRFFGPVPEAPLYTFTVA